VRCGLAVAWLAVAPPAVAGADATIERLAFTVSGVPARDAAVSGELRIPASARERVAAVVILHSSPGFDGRGAFYAEALNRAGLATVEIDYLHGRGIPASPRANLPHVYGTLGHLARHPRIDPARIGVMGFSWGGILALLTSSEALTRQYGDGQRFAAHLPLYPICWRHRGVLAGTPGGWTDLAPAVYRRLTGAPVHILAGARDDYDGEPGACPNFVADLPAEARARVALTVYPDATFGWDSRFSSAAYDRGAKQGTGGIVTVAADAAIAARSRAFAVEFFRQSLGLR
jgi:dienelactone hydrolase